MWPNWPCIFKKEQNIHQHSPSSLKSAECRPLSVVVSLCAPRKLEVAIPATLRGVEVDSAKWMGSGKRGSFSSLFPIVLLEKQYLFLEGIGSKIEVQEQKVLQLPPVICMEAR
jgi:hypothetical protein